MLPDSAALGRLAADPATGIGETRDVIDQVLWRRDVRNAAREVAASSIARGARDSAAIDGADLAIGEDSPMGRVVTAAQRLTVEASGQADMFMRAPLQVLAHLHTVAGAGTVDADALGRPRSDATADDPLNLGPLPDDAVGPALVRLAQWVTASESVPAILTAALVHAELMHLRPFAWGSGLIARATVRCILIARGVDPSMFTIPELGMLEQGRGAYVRAIRAYATGTDEGLVSSVAWFTTALRLGAQAVTVP